MARFYIDNDVPVQLAEELQAWGHVALHTRDQPGMNVARDSHQFFFAVQGDYVLVVHNRKDFVLLHDAWRRWMGAWCGDRAHPGILIVPQHVPAATLAQAIHDHVTSGVTLTNQLYEWSPAAGWRQRPFQP